MFYDYKLNPRRIRVRNVGEKVREGRRKLTVFNIRYNRYCRYFINRTSKFIRLPRCSRKTMVACKRHDDLYWFRPKPYV